MFKKLILTMCVLGISAFAYGGDGDGTMTVPTVDKHCDGNGCMLKYTWTWATDADDTYATVTTAGTRITGKIVGVRVKPSSVATDYTVTLVDSAGHDILQGVFSDTEADELATLDNNFRVPVDDTSGGYIWVYDEFLYISVTNAGSSDAGDVEVYVHIP